MCYRSSGYSLREPNETYIDLGDKIVGVRRRRATMVGVDILGQHARICSWHEILCARLT